MCEKSRIHGELHVVGLVGEKFRMTLTQVSKEAMALGARP
jgi:hypothetical protein